MNYGEESDFKGKNLNGTYALASRGKVTFSNMVKFAKGANAKGLIVVNNTSDDEPFLAGNIDFAQIPVFAVGSITGKEMIENKQTITLTSDPKAFNIPNPLGMSEFSTWGPGVEEDFKPEITAPGGHVYSTVNDGEYADQYGTSMATPQVTGGATLVSQRVKKEFSKVKGKDRNILIKNLLMSTAVPKKEATDETYVSPRSQGAGIMDVDAAINTNVIVVNKDTLESKINMKDQMGAFDLNIRVINLGNETEKFNLSTTIQTDLVKDNFMKLKPRLLDTVSGGEITLNPNETKDITIKIDAQKFEKELSLQMKSGYFIEGFVRLTNSKQSIGLPYMSFHGGWDKIPVIEKSIYDFDLAKEKPTYFDEDGEEGNFTYLASNLGEERFVLGSILENNKTLYKKDRIVISPNGDNNVDFAVLNATFLRNYNTKSFVLNVYKDGETNSFFQTTLGGPGKRNFYSDTPSNAKSFGYSSTYYRKIWAWDGADKKDSTTKVKEGKYVMEFVVAADVSADFTNPEKQIYRFPVIVDLSKPEIKEMDFDPATRKLNINAVDKLSNIREISVIDNGKKIARNEDGTFTIPEGSDIEKLKIEVLDDGFNKTTKDGKEIPKKKLVSVSFNEEANKVLKERTVVSVDEAKVERKLMLDEKTNKFSQYLAKGKYTIKVDSIPKHYKVDKPSIEFEIKDDTKEEDLNFNFKLERVYYDIEKIEKPAEVKVKKKTKLDDLKKKVKSTVKITLNDPEKTVYEVPVNYDFTKVDFNKAGKYEVKGVLDLSKVDLIKNSGKVVNEAKPTARVQNSTSAVDYSTTEVTVTLNVEVLEEKIFNITVTLNPEAKEISNLILIRLVNSNDNESVIPYDESTNSFKTQAVEGNYRIRITNLPDKWIATESTKNISLVDKDETVSFEINKVKEIKTRDIKVDRIFKGKALNDKNVTIRLKKGSEDVRTYNMPASETSYVFKDVVMLDENDKEIQYTVTQDTIEGYKTLVSGNIADGFKIVNTPSENINIKVITNKEDAKPESIDVILEPLNVKLTLDASNNYMGEFKNLPKFDEEGNEITYKATVTDVPGFILEVTYDQNKGFVVKSQVKKFKVSFNRIGVDNIPIEGSKLELLSSKGEVLVDFLSMKEAKTVELTPGEYTLREVSAPMGYEKANDIKFVINELGEVLIDGEVVDKTIELTSKQVKFNVMIENLDEKSGELVLGSQMVIVNELGEVVDQWLTDGQIHSVMLLEGNYKLVELNNAKDYKKAKEVSFTVSKDLKLVVMHSKNNNEIKIEGTKKPIDNPKKDDKIVDKNTKPDSSAATKTKTSSKEKSNTNAKNELPNTGEETSVIFLLMGLAFITLGIRLIKLNKKKVD